MLGAAAAGLLDTGSLRTCVGRCSRTLHVKAAAVRAVEMQPRWPRVASPAVHAREPRHEGLWDTGYRWSNPSPTQATGRTLRNMGL